jgi:hypothetical protein
MSNRQNIVIGLLVVAVTVLAFILGDSLGALLGEFCGIAWIAVAAWLWKQVKEVFKQPPVD